MNTCPNCKKVAGLHSSILQGCVYQYAMQAPLQRTWVGLAAEDRLTAKYMQDAPDGIEAVIDYIEAKLKEKNSA